MEQTKEQIYKNWMEQLSTWIITILKVGKELSGETYLQKLEKEFHKLGAAGFEALQIPPTAEMGTDCKTIGKICDTVDEIFGNPWDGYVENSPTGFEKHLLSCPVTDILSQAPEICTRLVPALANGMASAINPHATIKFYECLSKGDKTCHYRVEINKPV